MKTAASKVLTAFSVLMLAVFAVQAQYSYTTLDHPLAMRSTLVLGISGTNIVGAYRTTNLFNHGFLYNGSTWTALDDPLAAGHATYANAVSGANIVGYYQDPSASVIHGFIVTPPIPQLSINLAGNALTISWVYPSSGWTLQQNPDLTTANWTPSAGVSNDGINNFVTITSPAGNLFFRLSQ